MKKYLFISISCLVYAFLGYFAVRENFYQLIGAFALLFAIYFLLIKESRKLQFKEIIGVAILFRLVLLFVTPNFSDDYFRFIWDGRLLASGENPYLYLPQESLNMNEIQYLDLDGEIYEGMNSKQYFTIYPPINQLCFAFSTFFGFQNPLAEIILLRLLIILSEIGVFILLRRLLLHFKKDENNLVLYALNPLVIVELTGNLHFEGMMLFFMLLSVWLWIKSKHILSPIVYAMAICTKLIPLMFLPFLFRKIGFWKTVLFGAICSLATALFFAPFISMELIENMGSSVDLYFQKFEFNASLYYLARELGMSITGYNEIGIIGPALSITVMLLLLGFAFQNYFLKNQFPERIVIALTIYLLFATTVHPWYIITILGISVLSKSKYPVFWSFLVVLSYSHYHGGGYSENYVLIILEYSLLLGVIVFEQFQVKKKVSSLEIDQ